jgi:hypothetical protein
MPCIKICLKQASVADYQKEMIQMNELSARHGGSLLQSQLFRGQRQGGLWSETSLGKVSMRYSYLKNRQKAEALWGGGLPQVVERLPSKQEALSATPILKNRIKR